jgi:hypothetical protein
MTESRIPLLESRSATADVNGTARIEIVTATSHEYWEVTSTVITTRTVGTNNADVGPTFRLYLDTDSNAGLIDVSFNGTDDVTDTKYELYPGRRLLCIWVDMEPGNEATVRLQGTRILKGNRGF